MTRRTRAPMKSTTVRFGPDLWRLLEREAANAGVPVSQFIRDAALARAVAIAAARGEGPFELLARAVREAMRHEDSASRRFEAERHLAALARLTASDRQATSAAIHAQSEQAIQRREGLARKFGRPAPEAQHPRNDHSNDT